MIWQLWHGVTFQETVDRENCNPFLSVMTWGNTPYTQSFFSQTVPYMVILYTTCAFSQNLLEFPVSAISGLLIAMRCYSTFPSISDGCKWQRLLSLLFHRLIRYNILQILYYIPYLGIYMSVCWSMIRFSLVFWSWKAPWVFCSQTTSLCLFIIPVLYDWQLHKSHSYLLPSCSQSIYAS